MFIMFTYFLKTVHSFNIIFYGWFWYYFDNLLFKNASQLKDLCWVILLILLEFFFTEVVKACLKKFYKDVFCITLMLTALNFFGLLEAILVHLLVSIVVFFLISWELLGLYS